MNPTMLLLMEQSFYDTSGQIVNGDTNESIFRQVITYRDSGVEWVRVNWIKIIALGDSVSID